MQYVYAVHPLPTLLLSRYRQFSPLDVDLPRIYRLMMKCALNRLGEHQYPQMRRSWSHW